MAERRRFFNSRERTALYLVADGRCTRCGAELPPGWHADHRDPYSAHRAMIQAGLRPYRFTVQASSADSVVKSLRSNLPPEMLAEVVDKLSA